MRTLAVLVVAITLAFEAHAQSLCMSESELQAFRRDIVFTASMAGNAICGNRYAAYGDGFSSVQARISEVHRGHFRENASNYLVAFERAYADDAGRELNRLLDSIVPPLLTEYRRMTLEQCLRFSRGLIHMFDLDSATPRIDSMNLAADAVLALGGAEAVSLPKCPRFPGTRVIR